MIERDVRIVHAEGREPFANYRFAVFDDGKLIAEIEFSYRGEDDVMRIPGGPWIDTDKSLEGGGSEPLRLTESGLRDLKRLTGQ